MSNEELEQLADELGDIQTAIAYVLFRRGGPTLKGTGEKELLSQAAHRLRQAARRLETNSIKGLRDDSYAARLPA